MGNYFIAVGGTGQMVALAYLRLTKLCGFKPADIYLMDCDDTGPITEDLTRMLGEHNIRKIRPIPERDNLGQLKDIFADARFNNNIDPVLSLLFTEKEEMTPVSTGMYGRPPVGASALKTKIFETIANPANDPALTNLTNALAVGQHRVAVSGSLLGGTGAGGVSTLAQHIRQNAGAGIRITIIDFVKWFLLESDDNHSADTTSIEDKRLQVNAESGVFYLQDKIARGVDACVLLGLPDPVSIKYKQVGQQTDVCNFINLLAAVLTNNSFAGNYNAIFPQPNVVYGYVIPDNGLRPAGLSLLLPDDNNRIIATTIDKIIMLAKSTERFLGYLSKYLQGGLPAFDFTPFLSVPNKLRRAIRLLSLANHMNEKQTCEVVIKKVAQKMGDLGACIGWFFILHSQGIFEFENKDLILTTQKYKKAENLPMPFLRKWLNGMNLDNWIGSINAASPADTNTEVFVNQMIIGLRREINRTFLNKHFGNMTWLNF